MNYNLIEIEAQVPTINENINIAESDIGFTGYDVCKNDLVLVKINKDIKNYFS